MALSSLIFIIKKRKRDTKERNAAFVSNQITYIRYDERNISFSTVKTDSVFLTVLIYAHKLRSIVMLDIKNDFLHTENYKYVLIMIRGKLAELLVKLDPKLYQKYVITSKQGVPILYVKPTKAIYGMFCSTILF